MAKHETPRELTGTPNVAEGIASLSPVIVALALMLAELLAQHELLVAKLMEQGILDGEELDEFCSRYTKEHLPDARQRVVETLKSSLEGDDAPAPEPPERFSVHGATARPGASWG
jgi:hypothetical protein